MRRGEGVVDIDLAKRSEIGGEGGVVRLFPGVETQILEKRELAIAESGHHRLGLGADTVAGEGHGAAQCLAQLGRDGGKGEGRIGLALGPTEMRHDDHLGALGGEFRQGRRQTRDPRPVRDLAIIHGNVEVGAHQHALAGDIGRIEGGETGHRIS